jgi:hypothetical protein
MRPPASTSAAVDYTGSPSAILDRASVMLTLVLWFALGDSGRVGDQSPSFAALSARRFGGWACGEAARRGRQTARRGVRKINP